MKRLILPILLLLTSCGSIGVSKKEKEAVEKVVSLYGGGEYKYKKTVGFKNTSRENTFQIEISGSPLFKTFSDDLETVASGIAYNLYQELGESKSKYDLFQISIRREDGLSQYDFTLETIQDVEQYVPLLNKTLKQIEDNKHKQLYSNVEHSDTNMVLISLDDAKMICNMSDSLIGDFEDQSFFSFRYKEYPNLDGRMLQLSSSIQGTKANGFITVIINPVNGRIVGLHIS